MTTTVSEKDGFAQSVLNVARENPVSTALIGMGALWMFAGGNRVSALGRALDAGRDAVSGVGSSLGKASSAMQTHSGDAVSAVAGAAGSAASGVGEGLSGTAASLRSGIGSAADGSAAAVERARAGAAQATRMVGDGARDITVPMQGSLADLWDRQPLLLGGVGLLVGAGLASMLPRTAFEEDLIGETGDAIRAQARGLLSAQADRAQRVMDAVNTEARAQGLTIEGVKNVGGAIVEQATEAAKDAGAEISGDGARIS